MIRKIMFSVFVLVAFVGFAQQKSINNYKYIIVPTQFDFLKSPDQYKVNSLTKFLFNKYGFTAFLSDEIFPNDLAKNSCSALTANVKNNSGMFTTKSIIELKDCNNNVVYTSTEGKSKQKEYQKAFYEAIRGAFKSIQTLNYKYDSTGEVVVATPILVPTETKIEYPTNSQDNEPIKPIDTSSVLYAQAITNGFQLVSTKPKVVFQILKSSKKDLFFIKNKRGIVFQYSVKFLCCSDTIIQ